MIQINDGQKLFASFVIIRIVSIHLHICIN